MQTDRLGFSKWTPSSVDNAKLLWGDPEVTRFTASGKLEQHEVLARLAVECSNDDQYGVQYWPIFLRSNDEFVGCCGLRPFDLANGIYEIGFHLLKTHWGKGYATEAAKAVLDHAFNVLHAQNVCAGHHPQNMASKRTLEKLGFHYIHDSYYEPTGLYHPSYRYYV